MGDKSEIKMEITSSQDLFESLLELRLAAGMTQQQAADATDLNRVYVSRLETGNIPTQQVERILELINLYGGKLVVQFESGED